MAVITIYHNPRCSKSRQTLALLNEQIQHSGDTLNIVEYLHNPPDANTLKQLLTALQLTPRELLRTKEAAYKDNNLAAANDEELLAAMQSHPILIERPIVVNGNKAVIGRPPENISELF